MSADLTHITTWLFDLDNTLYPAESGFMGEIERRMTAFVQKVTRTRRDPTSVEEQIVDLGFVGESKKIDPRVIEDLIQSPTEYIPVVAPIGVGEDGATYNINADTVAGALAGAVKAKRMLLLTDVAGVMDANRNLIRQLTVKEARAAIADKVATGGMIPKLETAIEAVDSGVEAVVILDGRRPHAMLTELFTEHGAGTLVRA